MSPQHCGLACVEHVIAIQQAPQHPIKLLFASHFLFAFLLPASCKALKAFVFDKKKGICAVLVEMSDSVLFIPQ